MTVRVEVRARVRVKARVRVSFELGLGLSECFGVRARVRLTVGLVIRPNPII